MNNMITDRMDNDTFYNYSDLNRVEAKTAQIANMLTVNGYITTIQVKTDWTRSDFPTKKQMIRYLNNVKKCVTQYCNMPGATLPISMNDLDYIGANDIEKTLVNIENLVDYMLSAMRYSGTFFSGHFDSLRGYCI